MPRASTQLSATNKWLRANRVWLTDQHAPLTQQLVMLARSMDAELADTGRVTAAMSSAYRLAMGDLNKLNPHAARTATAGADDDEGLFGPAA